MTTPIVIKLTEALCTARWGDTAVLDDPAVMARWERVAVDLLNETIPPEPEAIYTAYYDTPGLDYQELTPATRSQWEACAWTATGWVIPF